MLGRLREKEYFCSMNELAIIIEYLLLSRNSVIVPNLGAFTTRTFASQWQDDEEVFLPPVRHIRFNSDVFQDPQNFFVRALEQIYQLDEDAAQQYCADMVSEFHKMLVVEGTVDFGSIGLFTMEDDMEIVMSPYECGITSPSYYGLDAFHFPLLSSLSAEADDDAALNSVSSAAAVPGTGVHAVDGKNTATDTVKCVVAPKNRTYIADDKHIIIRLNRAFVHYTMVAAASVILFFLLGPSVQNDQAGEAVKEATINQIMKPAKEEKPALKVVEVGPAEAEQKEQVAVKEQGSEADVQLAESSVEAVNNVPENESQPVVQEKESTSQILNELRGQYSIVLASAVSRRNAAVFVERLAKNDVHAIIYDNGKILRVLIDGFASQADAYNMNNYLHNLDKELSSTWVMKN